MGLVGEIYSADNVPAVLLQHSPLVDVHSQCTITFQNQHLKSYC